MSTGAPQAYLRFEPTDTTELEGLGIRRRLPNVIAPAGTPGIGRPLKSSTTPYATHLAVRCLCS